MRGLTKDICFKIVLMKFRRLERKYAGYIFIFAFAGIGDLCYSLAFIDELKTRRQKKIMLFTKGYLGKAASYYPAIDEVRILRGRTVRLVKSFLSHPKNRKYINDGVNRSRIYYFSQWDRFGWEVLRLPSFTYMDVERYILYNFDDKAKISYPTVPQLTLSNYEGMDFQNTVIVSPYSNFLKIDDIYVFNAIVELLKERELEVYTNAMPGQEILAGTKRLECSLEELYSLSREVRAVVSIRSGILDFLANSGGRLIVLYPDRTPWDKIFRKAYRLDAWHGRSEIWEFFMNDTEKIMRYIRELTFG